MEKKTEPRVRAVALVESAQNAFTHLETDRKRSFFELRWWQSAEIRDFYSVVTPASIAVDLYLRYLTSDQRRILRECLEVIQMGWRKRVGIPDFYQEYIDDLCQETPVETFTVSCTRPSESSPERPVKVELCGRPTDPHQR